MTLSQDQASDSSHPDASFLAPGTKMSLAKNHPTNAPSKPLAHESGVTALLARLRNGNRNASLPPDPRLLELVNVEIKRLTNQAWVRSLGGKLEKSDLVNDVWLKLLAESHHSQPWASREHFFNTVALTMQQVIVDHIRRNKAQKRTPDGQRVPIDSSDIPSKPTSEDILLVADALQQLEIYDPHAACVVRLKYFGGYNQQEIVQILDVPLATIRKHWTFGRTWIKTYIIQTRAE